MVKASCHFGRRANPGVARKSSNSSRSDLSVGACAPRLFSPFEDLGRVYITPGDCDIGCRDENHQMANGNENSPGE
jgi:hypothetical protein